MSAPVRVPVRGPRGAPPDDVTLLPVVDHLLGGGLLAYPTETVYGFGSTLDEAPLERLSALKGREVRRPFLLLVPDVAAVQGLAWTKEALDLAAAFWPGAVTLVLGDPSGLFPPGVRSPDGAVAVRRTSHPLARRLVELLEGPLTSTSANAPGDVPASDGEGAWAAAVALGSGAEMWVLDAGPLPESAPSTIVDCTGSVPRLLRAGATPERRLRCVVPGIEAKELEP